MLTPILFGLFAYAFASNWRPLLQELSLPDDSIEAVIKIMDKQLVSVTNAQTFSQDDWKNLVTLGLPYGPSVILQRHFGPSSPSPKPSSTEEPSLGWLAWVLEAVTSSLTDHPKNDASYLSCHGTYCIPWVLQLALVFCCTLLLAFEGSPAVPQVFLLLSPVALCYSLLCRAGWSFLFGTLCSFLFGAFTIIARGSLGLLCLVMFVLIPGVVYFVNQYFQMCGGLVLFFNTFQLIFTFIFAYPCGTTLRDFLAAHRIGTSTPTGRNMC